MSDDIQKLQGAWNMTSLEIDGTKLPDSASSNSQIIIDGDHFTALGMGAVYEGNITLNTAINPKTIDMKFTEGPEKGGSSLGIYDLDGDNWKICLTTSKRARPISFETAPKSGLALETFVRASSKKSKVSQSAYDKTVPLDLAQVTSFEDLTFEPSPELQGAWSLVSGIRDGIAFDDKMIKWGKRVTKGCETTITFGGQVYIKSKVKVDISKNPREIDFYIIEGQFSGKMQYGIYEIRDGLLKVNFASPGDPRPADFTSNPGESKTLTVWKK